MPWQYGNGTGAPTWQQPWMMQQRMQQMAQQPGATSSFINQMMSGHGKQAGDRNRDQVVLAETGGTTTTTPTTATTPASWHFANDAWKWETPAGSGGGGNGGGGSDNGSAGAQHVPTGYELGPNLNFESDRGFYAAGGAVHPPRGLRGMAQHVARQGRGDDTSLVHMTPDEIRGLSRLAPGGRLPINPRTGYPEAGILSGLLGVIGGIGGSFIGMPWLGAGLGSMGGGLLEGKDFGTALTGGILSGLGGYGLGQAAGMLGEAGASAGGEAAAQTAQLAKNGVQAAPLSEMAQESVSPFANQAASQAASQAALQGAGSNSAASMSNPMSMQQWSDKASNVMRGATDPEALWKTFGTNAGKTTLPIGVSLYGQSLMDGQQQQGRPYIPQQQGNYPTLPGPNKRKYIPAPANWDYSTGKEWDYFTPAFALGGPIQPAGGRPGRSPMPQPQMQMPQQMPQRPTGQMPIRQMPPQQMPPQQMPMQGIRFAGGGSISGPGSGLDDAIPAVINGRQPAKLSSGEWVAPAHFVSALGDGSSEAGVHQLDQMVNRVMMRKYGTENRKPNPIGNPKKVMPA
jgi:hypothetical protein